MKKPAKTETLRKTLKIVLLQTRKASKPWYIHGKTMKSNFPTELPAQKNLHTDSSDKCEHLKLCVLLGQKLSKSLR